MVKDFSSKPNNVLKMSKYLFSYFVKSLRKCLMHDVRPVAGRSLQKLVVRSSIDTLACLNEENAVCLSDSVQTVGNRNDCDSPGRFIKSIL